MSAGLPRARLPLTPAEAAPAPAPWPVGVLAAACAVGLGVVLPVLLARAAGAGTVRLLFPVYALAIGAVLASRRPALYPAFCIGLFAFAPFLRRLIDYEAGWVAFNPVLLAPYVALLPTAASLARRMLLPGRQAGWAFAAISACAFYGMVLALLQGLIVQGLYEPLRWVLPVGLCAFIAEHARESEATHRAVVGALAAVVPIVALYGIAQYVSPPVWDVFWMQNLGVGTGSFGQPEAFKIRPFGTLNSPGSLGLFLAAAVVVLAGAGRFLAASAGSALLVLSVVRAGWLAAAVGLVVLLLRTSPRRKVSLACAVLALAFAASAGLGAMQLGPEVFDGVSSRLDSLSNLGADDSAGERLQTYRAFFDRLADAPLGEGFGANDSLAAAVSKQNRVTLDSGILDVFLTFGVVGGTVWFLAVGFLIRSAWREVPRSRDMLAGHLGAVAGLVSAFPLGTTAIGEVGILGWVGLGLLLAGAGRADPAAQVPAHVRSGPR